MEQSEVFAIMRERGWAKVIVEYSGGNDEGGADHIKVLDVDGNELTELMESYMRPEDGNGALADAFARPVYDAYGSFAGEFYCDGSVTWDAAAETVEEDDNYHPMDAYNDEG